MAKKTMTPKRRAAMILSRDLELAYDYWTEQFDVSGLTDAEIVEVERHLTALTRPLRERVERLIDGLALDDWTD